MHLLNSIWAGARACLLQLRYRAFECVLQFGLCAVFIGFTPSRADAQSTEQSSDLDRLVDAARRLCSGKGSEQGVTVTVDGHGSAVAKIVVGDLAGSASFSREDWDGISGMRGRPDLYVDCVNKAFPLIVQTFKPKQISYYVVPGRSSPKIRSQFISDDEMVASGCDEALQEVQRERPNCNGELTYRELERCNGLRSSGTTIFSMKVEYICTRE